MRATCMHCMRMRYLLMRRQEITLMHASTCSVVSVRQRRPLWTIYLLAAVAAGIWVASLLRCSSECTKTLGDPPRAGAARVSEPTVKRMAPVLVVSAADFGLHWRFSLGRVQPRGMSGQASTEWCSLRHCLHLTVSFALPEKASLYSAWSSVAQLRLREAAAWRRYRRS